MILIPFLTYIHAISFSARELWHINKLLYGLQYLMDGYKERGTIVKYIQWVWRCLREYRLPASPSTIPWIGHGPLARYVILRIAHAPGVPGSFPHHCWLVILACITARASRPCRDECRDRWLSVSFEIGVGENVPDIPGACATRNVTYLVRGPWELGLLNRCHQQLW